MRFLHRDYADYLHFEFKMAQSRQCDSISRIRVHHNVLVHSLGQVRPYFTLAAVLPWIRGLDLVLHGLGRAACFHFHGNARIALHTTCYTLRAKPNRTHIHRKNTHRYRALLDNIVPAHRSLVHHAAAQAIELAKRVECQAARRHARRPHHSIQGAAFKEESTFL